MTYLRKRNLFLSIASGVALLVGLIATLLPETFLVLKGVAPVAGPMLWMRETGLLLLGFAGFAFGGAPTARLPIYFALSHHQCGGAAWVADVRDNCL